MSNTVCDHQWIEYFDAAEDAACYRDGFNYRPAVEVCTKCRKTKRTRYDDEMKWYEIPLVILVSVVALLYLGVIAPVLMLVVFIHDEFLSKRNG
jgi:hypothetical protein